MFSSFDVALTTSLATDALAFVLLHPSGQPGHHSGLGTIKRDKGGAPKLDKKGKMATTTLTLMQYGRAMLVEPEAAPEDVLHVDVIGGDKPIRVAPNVPLMTGGYLLQMYTIDKWLSCEDARLNFDKKRSKHMGVLAHRTAPRLYPPPPPTDDTVQ